MLGFKVAHDFVKFCAREKDKGAPHIIQFSARKRYVDRQRFETWMREKIEAA